MRCNRRTFLAATGLAAASFTLNSGRPCLARAAASDRRKEKRIPTVCGLCRARCPMLARLKGNEVRLQGNPVASRTAAALCARGMAATQILHHPDRLKFPLRRVGPRGSGRWQRISWDDALAEIHRQCVREGVKDVPGALALLSGGPSSFYIETLVSRLKGRIFTSAAAHNDSIRSLGYGPVTGMVPDPLSLPTADRVDCLVLMGSHCGENVQLPQLRGVAEILAGGAKLIVVDPRFSTMAGKADFHLALRPGTDTALLLGWINFLFVNDLLNLEGLASYCTGLEELREHVLDYTPQRVAEITGLSEDLITATGWLLAAQPGRTFIMPGNHLSWYGHDVSRVQAQAILSVLLDSPTVAGQPFDFALKPERADFSQLVSSVENGEVQVLALWGQNPLQAEISPYRTMAALEKTPFIFATDILPGESLLYADIILPEAAFLERTDVLETWQQEGKTFVSCRFPVVAPPQECREPYAIVKAIADGLGHDTLFPDKDVGAYLDRQLADYGATLAALRRAGGVMALPSAQDVPEETGESAFATPSGRIELSPSWNRQHGLPSLPQYVPPRPLPKGFVRLLYGRAPAHSQSQTHSYSWLNQEMATNQLWLSPKSARAFGVEDGQQVRLENQDGLKSLTTVEVKVTPGIRDDCCYLAHGFGNRSPLLREAFMRGVSDTILMTRGVPDPCSGVRGMRDNFVRVVKGGGHGLL